MTGIVAFSCRINERFSFVNALPHKMFQDRIEDYNLRSLIVTGAGGRKPKEL